MKNLLVPLLIVALAGCATTASVPLSQIQTKRMFKIDRATALETVRMFALREEFRVSSFEESTGRVIGSKKMQSRAGETGKTVIMNIRMNDLEPKVTEVDARFAFYEHQGEMSKDDESILADCYVMLFGMLSDKEGG
jgi:hypothetical protein